jgi:tRNA threonylcarbamoyladenosine biosynthesis protein TsaE
LIKVFEELVDITKYIKDTLPDGGIVLLIGDLASGKTTLVQNFVKYLGLKDEATSPTFSILNVYDDRIYHYDIYNEGSDKFLESGLLENFEKDGYHFIEWADEKLEKMIEVLGFEFMKIEIKNLGNRREYRITNGS